MAFVLDLLGLGAPLLQEEAQHRAALVSSAQLQAKMLRLERQWHVEGENMCRRFHEEETEFELGAHLENKSLTIETARRAHMRETSLEHHSELQTLFAMTLLMIGGSFSVVTVGVPSQTWPFILPLFAGLSAFSVGTLFCGAMLIGKCQSRMGGFNIYIARQVYSCGLCHETFEQFFDCHCKRMYTLARRVVIVGTACIILAAGLLMLFRFDFHFDNILTASGFMGWTVVVVVVICVLHFCLKVETRRDGRATLDD